MAKTTAELIAEHLAKKGATKVAVGESNNIPNGMWYKAAQGQVDLNEKLADGPLEPKAKRKAKPAREGEVFYHSAWKRSN
jgi:hypothetical protein